MCILLFQLLKAIDVNWTVTDKVFEKPGLTREKLTVAK